MVSSIDDGVGDIVLALKENNIYDKTIIYFLSDNGGAKSNASNNTPLNSHKGTLYEGGIRIPFVMQWPNQIEGGTLFKKPIISLDIFATSKAIINPDLELKNKFMEKTYYHLLKVLIMVIHTNIFIGEIMGINLTLKMELEHVI